jgi:hypothetical protein
MGIIMNRRKRPPDGGSALPPRTKRYEASRAFGEVRHVHGTMIRSDCLYALRHLSC